MRRLLPRAGATSLLLGFVWARACGACPDRDLYRRLPKHERCFLGVTYRARQRHSKRIVALKRVLSYHGDSREMMERFPREAEAAASLDHPNILPIYEVSESEGLPFFTMKYATGGARPA